MAQFDIYENEDVDSREAIPFLLDVQHDMLTGLRTRIVIPLVQVVPASENIKRLCPRFKVLEKDVVMSTPEIAGYPVKDLRHKVFSLAEYRGEILAAIDFALTGY